MKEVGIDKFKELARAEKIKVIEEAFKKGLSHKEQSELYETMPTQIYAREYESKIPERILAEHVSDDVKFKNYREMIK